MYEGTQALRGVRFDCEAKRARGGAKQDPNAGEKKRKPRTGRGGL